MTIRGKTTWHRVVVSGELVEQLRTGVQTGQIKKGRPVQLTGTEVTNQQETPKGGRRTTTEFYATSVIRLRNGTAPQPQAR
jgi:single-stranded DNA-binding protein